jgi:hypothetical protein
MQQFQTRQFKNNRFFFSHRTQAFEPPGYLNKFFCMSKLLYSSKALHKQQRPQLEKALSGKDATLLAPHFYL